MLCCARCSNEISALTVFCPNCQHPNEPDFKQLINQKLSGRFQLYRQLGEGGLSTVFAAIDLQTDKTVVVKVSDPRHLTQTSFNSPAELLEARAYWTEMTERMQREVAALTDVQHSNIVRVLAAGAISNELSYVVMELLRGKTLRDELTKRGKLPVNEAVAIALEVARGLSIIHARGIVHRDLTPRNIFLGDEDGSTFVKLIDFGIAKFPKPAGAQTYTQHAVMAGTPGYAAPEQFQNLPLDHRADLYSLGVVLYEMLTGEKPFTGRTATEIALKQLTNEAIRPRAIVPDLPLRLEALILRALAKDPLVRQQSTDSFVAELQAISSRVEIPFAAPVAAASLVAPEPSGTEVFTLLSDLAQKPTGKAAAKAEVEQEQPQSASTTAAAFAEPNFELNPPHHPQAWVVAAGLGILITLSSLLYAHQSGAFSSASPEPLVEASATPVVATPTPTIRPDVTAPRNDSELTVARNRDVADVDEPAKAKTSVLASASQPASIKTVPVSNSSSDKPVSAIPAVQPVATPTPASTRARTTQPAITTPPVISATPTPTPAPAPVVASLPAPPREGNGGWRREPAPTSNSRVERPPQVIQPRREVIPADPKVISWRGQVDGSRVITLEVPGVPGMVVIPGNYRKKVGVVEPPSPSNNWRCVRLRVFGHGDVSLIVRWVPQRETQRQELVRW